MKKVTLKRLSMNTTDEYLGVERTEIMGDGRLISIQFPTKEITIPVANIDYIIEEEI